MLKLIEEIVLEKLQKHPRLATFGISIAIAFAILAMMGTLSESHQAFAGGIPEPTHR
jgi:hypothetical protein